MYKNNKRDFLLKSKIINLLSSSKILIIGGGEASYIKLKTFAKRDFKIDILSIEFNEKIVNYIKNKTKIKLIKNEYRSVYLKEYELIIIGTDNEETNDKIRYDCKKENKIFIDLENGKLGKITTPVEVRTENIKVGVVTSAGSPKTSLYIGEKIKNVIVEYDMFVIYIDEIRSFIKENELKRELMKFMNTDDFYEFFKRGKADLILKTFYGGDFFENSSSN